MKAGLLVCDHVNPAVQPKFGDYPDMFARLFPAWTWELYDVCNGHYPTSTNSCDVYLATGSLHSVYEDLQWIEVTKAFIRQLHQEKKKFIGFCFGHQLLGAALGGHVAKAPTGWHVGIHEFEVVSPAPWQQPPKDRLFLLMMCQDQVLELPLDTKVLASSPSCPHAMIQVGDHMLGIQGHPEFTKEYDRYLMELRHERIAQELVASAIESLRLENDAMVVREWVGRFLN